MRRQPLGVQDEEDDLDEAQGSLDDLPGPGGEQQADVVQQLLQGVDLDGIWGGSKVAVSRRFFSPGGVRITGVTFVFKDQSG